jgi:hypothetical protein
MNNFQFAPLRTLDDFLLESARFQLPNFGDFEKWGNRVVKNLLYYQTNYFVLGCIELIIIGLFQPVKIALGMASILAVIYALLTIYGPNQNPSVQQFQSVNKYAVLGLLLGIAYIFLYMFDAVLLVLFAILLPISSKFIHFCFKKIVIILINLFIIRCFHSFIIEIKEPEEQADNNSRNNWNQAFTNGTIFRSYGLNARYISVKECWTYCPILSMISFFQSNLIMI